MAYNGNIKTGDQSYGLLQINMIGALGVQRLKMFGISDYSQLFNPLTNMQAAYILWGGNDANFNTAWYINRSGPPNYYMEKYQANLPAAQAAAAQVEGTPVSTDPSVNPSDSTSTAPGDSGTPIDPSQAPTDTTGAPTVDLSSVNWTAVGLVGVGAAILAYLLGNR
jgi:hypothetical protein